MMAKHRALVIGVGLLLIGAAIQTVIGGACLYESMRSDAFIGDAAWQEAWRQGNTTTMNRLGREISSRVEQQAIIIAIVFTLIFLAVGKWVAREFESPPFLYYVLTGVLPAFLFFWGWQRIHGRTPEARTSKE